MSGATECDLIPDRERFEDSELVWPRRWRPMAVEQRRKGEGAAADMADELSCFVVLACCCAELLWIAGFAECPIAASQWQHCIHNNTCEQTSATSLLV